MSDELTEERARALISAGWKMHEWISNNGFGEIAEESGCAEWEKLAAVRP